MRQVGLLILFTFLIVGCSFGAPPGCGDAAVRAYGAQIAEQLRQFDQQAELVAASPRIGVAEPLQRLLDIQTATRALSPPPCLGEYHAAVVAVMEAEQDVYQDFAAQQVSDSVAGLLLVQLGERRDELTAQATGISSGQLPATPTPAPPSPTPDVLAAPEPVAVQVFGALSPVAGGGQGNIGVVCPADTLELFERRQVDGADWGRVRVLAIGEPDATCNAIATGIGRATVGAEGWLRDDELFAP